MIKKIWKWFWRPAPMAWGAIFIIGGFAGVFFLAGSIGLVKYTSTESFCISCHEMETTVFQEYKKSAHYNNASGVRATCTDCHVPRAWGPKLVKKIRASNDVYHTILGTINTPEKFEAKRFELATRVWDTMIKTDSRECRECHIQDAMDFTKQGRRASKKMQESFEIGDKTCIECHQGLVHKLPKDPNADD